MGDGGRCHLTSYLLLTCTYYLLLTTQAREMLSHNRDEATYLKLQARPPRPATQHRLQPYVLQAATHVPEAATVRARRRDRTGIGLVRTVELVARHLCAAGPQLSLIHI